MSQVISCWRGTCGIVALGLWLISLDAPTATSGGKVDSKTTEKIGVDPIPRVTYQYGPNYRYGIVANLTSEGGAKKLTYSADGFTNMGVIKVDGRVSELGGPAGRWLAAPARRSPSRKHMTQATWVHDTIRVTQILDIVPNPQPVRLKSGKLVRQLDRCLILYVLENAGKKSRKVGLRLEIDTLIGSNDGVPFTVPGLPGLVDNQYDFAEADKVPDFVQALERADLKNPGTIAQMSFKLGQGIEPPGRVSLTHWSRGFKDWEVPLQNLTGDSSVILYWNETDLAPKQKRTLGFSYGLGSITSQEGKLGLTLSGRFEKDAEFNVVATATNPQKGMTARLILPPELERTSGKEVEPVPESRNSGIITWRVRARESGQFKVRVETSNRWTATQAVTISDRPLLLNPILGDPKKKK